MEMRSASEDANLSDELGGENTVPSVSVPTHPAAGRHRAGGRLWDATSHPIFWGSEWASQGSGEMQETCLCVVSSYLGSSGQVTHPAWKWCRIKLCRI